jgi:hypothetical protein
MKKRAMLAVAAAAGLVLQSVAFAGLNSSLPVTAGSDYAYGGLTDARNSSDTKQYIGCYLGLSFNASGGQTSDYVSCSGQSASGAYYYCYVQYPSLQLTSLVAGLNHASYLYFYGDSAHHCLSVSVQNASWAL